MKGTPEERFWAKVDKAGAGECWLWTAVVNNKGYGGFWDGSRIVTAHRWAYEQLVGPIPKGLQLDHLCRVRGCVNPAHLEPVTCRENLLRGKTIAAANAAKTHCPRGHPLDGTKRSPTTGYVTRVCRLC